MTKCKIMKTPVVFCTDDNYVPFLLVAILSLIRNASYYVNVYVLHDGLCTENTNRLMRLQNLHKDDFSITPLDMREHFNKITVNSTNRFSRSAWFRLYIPQLFNDYKKVIYLDSDIIVRGDIAELDEEEVGGLLIGAVADKVMQANFSSYLQSKEIPQNEYFNSGVIVFNIKECVNNNIFQRCIEYITGAIEYSFPDQDILNLVFNNKVRVLDEKWNYQWHRHFGKIIFKYRYAEKRSLDDIAIIHYTSEFKPWVIKNNEYAKEWWKYYNCLAAMFSTDSLYFKEKMEKEKRKFRRIMIDRIYSKIRRVLKCGI